MISCEYSEIFKNNSFTEHLRATASRMNESISRDASVLWWLMESKLTFTLQESLILFNNFFITVFFFKFYVIKNYS